MGARLLIVDDDTDLLDSLRLTLEPEGYEVITTTGAENALHELGRRLIELVVTDYRMPGSTGLYLLSEIKRRYPGLPTILLTGFATLQLARDAIQEGAVARLLEKPVSVKELRHAIEETLAEYAVRPRLSRLVEFDLTSRELEIVAEWAEGRRVPELASRMFLSAHTVRNHLKSIFQKVRVHSQTELLDRLRSPSR